MKFTTEQQTIIDTAARGASFVVQAYAGSAKTTTLVAAAKAISRAFPGGKNLAVSFNKKIQLELEDRMRGFPDWEMRTFNSLGLGTLGANSALWPARNISFGKTTSIAGEVLAESGVRDWMNKHRFKFDLNEVIVDLADKVKVFGVKPEQVTPEVIMQLSDVSDESGDRSASHSALDETGSSIVNGLTKIVRSMTIRSIERARETGEIDFNDQVYLAMLYCPHHGRSWDRILVDEAQDLSYLNHLQVTRACKRQLGILGDKYQTLYQFRGATEDSMADLAAMWKTKTGEEPEPLKLSITFRCPVAIVERQSGTVGINDFKAKDTAILGTVSMPWISRGRTATWSFTGVADRLERIGSGDETAVVLSATNAPLYLAAALLWQDLSCQCTSDFTAWARFMANKPTPRQMDIATSPMAWTNPAWKNNPAIVALHYFHLVSGLNGKEIIELFVEDPNNEAQPIVFSTVHRAKGLEWDDVYLFDGLPEQGNLRYVAETRAKRQVCTLSSEDHWRAIKPKNTLQKYHEIRKKDTWKPVTDINKRYDRSIFDMLTSQPASIKNSFSSDQSLIDAALAIKLKLQGAEAYSFDPTGFIKEWNTPDENEAQR